MKCFWRICLTVAAMVAMVGSVSAQSDWNQPSQIGSYQSILSRAGYGGGGIAGQPFSQASAPIQGSGSSQAIPQGVVQGSGSSQAIPQGGFQGGGFQGGGFQGGGFQGGAVQSMPVQGAVQGCATGNCGGGVSYGGGPAYGGGQIYGGGFAGSGGFNNGGFAGGPVAGGFVGGGVGGGLGGDGLIGVPCGQNDAFIAGGPVYQPGAFAADAGVGLATAGLRGGGTNTVVGLYGLFFTRDYEDGRALSFNQAGGRLFSDDADHGSIGGFGATLTRRNAKGRGFQLGYWGLDETASASLDGPGLRTNLLGLNDVLHGTSGLVVYDVFDLGDRHTVTRDTEITNFEANRLVNGGSFKKGRHWGTYELLAGFRYFGFDEGLSFSSFYSGGFPRNIAYNIRTRNRLAGFQVGGRSEFCLSKKLRLGLASKVGIFGNRASSDQRIIDETGYISVVNSGPNAGRDFDYSSKRDDVSILGEVDLSVIYQTSQRSRLVLGYRALGVAGVALAADQIPFDFTDARDLQDIRTNGSLLLHGGYAGLEWCF